MQATRMAGSSYKLGSHGRLGGPGARHQARRIVATQAKAKQIELMNADIAVRPSVFEEVLRLREVESWPTWECEASTFPWTYEESEEAYITEGECIVTPSTGEPISIKKGDFVTFPKGMSCVWDVKEPIKKHYNMF
ncbi:DUF861 domain-containing protein [Chloropicon primus]|uniref:(S)-ureidoglycine aminohydrolase cupin domain-containing protein n=2 Tax=Chloropicon primus TaxID=1764295 RepID=A0A5B8MJ09_9CHLO|nr:hypothetical protein A3770_03p26020 [Chloropicon primus]UPQ99296.1 DUF861 domain-containing protein [Chloropicon primus]|eukprot:QDZ20084.1 hypothetical protein A3770_03p26020 [Chloropicon primus]